MNENVKLARLLGRRDAFNLVAARCSAADAALLRDMRNDKLYLGQAENWDQFCTEVLHTTKDYANRMIRNLDEFGPGFFEVAQFVPLSPAAYRMIAPAIEDHTLHHNGESIELVQENARKVVAAVTEMRKAAKEAEPQPPADPIPILEQHCSDLIREITELIDRRQYDLRVQASIGYLRSRLANIELTI